MLLFTSLHQPTAIPCKYGPKSFRKTCDFCKKLLSYVLFLEAVGGCASVLHQNQGNKSIRGIHEIQKTRVITNEGMKENLRIPARQWSMVTPIGTEGSEKK